MHRLLASLGLGIATATLLVLSPAAAQQATGELGSPSATTTIPGDVLPAPAPPFGGEINLNANQSRPWWPPRVVPPEGAPNVLLIMTDDSGYGVPGTFGGVIPTPALDRIAANGTPLHQLQLDGPVLANPGGAASPAATTIRWASASSPSRRPAFPATTAIIDRNSATIGRILREHGYATSWFGKDHNTPAFQASQAGPFDQWPTGMGFEYFYGFVGGDANQWQPNLFRNTTPIYPFEGKPGWNLITAMADEAIQHMKMLDETQPDKPFFVYYVPGATHAPHHPTPEWIEKISAMHLFDDGWNKLRDTIFANQKRAGR